MPRTFSTVSVKGCLPEDEHLRFINWPLSGYVLTLSDVASPTRPLKINQLRTSVADLFEMAEVMIRAIKSIPHSFVFQVALFRIVLFQTSWNRRNGGSSGA